MMVGGEPVSFVVHKQPQSLGLAGELQYWSMPPSELRALKNDDAEHNFASILLCRLLVMREQGWQDDPNEKCTVLLASAYREFCDSKSLRQVVRDSFPARGSILRGPPLPLSEQDRLAELCATHDRELIRMELDRILGHRPLSRAEEVGFEAAFGQWLGIGLARLEKQGSTGLQTWLQDMRAWMTRYRRNSKTSPLVRKFVDFFGYRAKSAFFLCYASFWRQLIPWLVEHHGLDEHSRRLMSLWHYQNQPVQFQHESPILIPTQASRSLIDPRTGQSSTIRWKPQQPRIKVLPDVFSGQVLSLHPLTWRLFSCDRLSEMLGQFLVSPRFREVTEKNKTDRCSEYWSIVQAILESAMLYRLALQNDERRRPTKSSRTRTSDDAIVTAQAPPDVDSVDEVTRQLNQRFGRCTECGDLLVVAKKPSPQRAKKRIRYWMQCRGCKQKFPHEANASTLRDLLADSDET